VPKRKIVVVADSNFAVMASGEILPGEGAALSATISAYVKVFETTEIEARISALEAREKIAEAA
jgi:hypothetical protein